VKKIGMVIGYGNATINSTRNNNDSNSHNGNNIVAVWKESKFGRKLTASISKVKKQRLPGQEVQEQNLSKAAT